MKIVLATGNAGKLREMGALLAPLSIDVSKFLGLPFEAGDVVEDGAVGDGLFVGVVVDAAVDFVFASFFADGVVVGWVVVGGSDESAVVGVGVVDDAALAGVFVVGHFYEMGFGDEVAEVEV